MWGFGEGILKVALYNMNAIVCLCPLKIQVLKCNTNADSIEKWGFREVIKSSGLHHHE
jgi:hypothetical protein